MLHTVIMKEKIINYSLNSLLCLCIGLMVFSLARIGNRFINPKPKVEQAVPVVSPKYKITPHVGQSFVPYLKDFLDDAYSRSKLPLEFNARLDALTIKFGNTKKIKENFAGYCDLHTTTVIVDYNDWNRYTPIEKQILIDHELGHCLLERNHRHVHYEFPNKAIQPFSIMYPNIMNAVIYAKNKKGYRDELFDPKRFDNYWYANSLMQENYATLSKKFKDKESLYMYVNNFVNNDLEILGEKKLKLKELSKK